MPDYLRAFCERAANGENDSGPIRFVASTENVARDGMIINADAWDLTNYQRNSVVLWSHDYFGSRPPIGRADVTLDKRQLIADVTFDSGDAFAADIERKVRAGFLNAVSVGWNTLEVAPAAGDQPARVTKADLLDISVVPVPADPSALAERQKRVLADYGAELVKLMEPEPTDDNPPETRNTNPASTEPTTPETDAPSARASWDDIAGQMVRLYRPYAQRPDDERKQAWQRLAREYGRLKKTPPEFQANAQIEALGTEELRGLFLEGETELYPDEFAWFEARAGKAISARNRERLEQALVKHDESAALIRDVLTSVKKEQDEEAEREVQDLASSLDDLFAGAIK